jgi:hypothetical protein
MIVCQCPNCIRLVQVSDPLTGKAVRCPLCLKPFIALPLAVMDTTLPGDDEVYTDLVAVDDEVIDLEPVEDEDEVVDLEPAAEDDFHLSRDDD